MTDLRTRIATVLSEHDPEGATLNEYHYELADVLIRELGLRREEQPGYVLHSGAGVAKSRAPKHRYVTEWTADE